MSDAIHTRRHLIRYILFDKTGFWRERATARANTHHARVTAVARAAWFRVWPTWCLLARLCSRTGRFTRRATAYHSRAPVGNHRGGAPARRCYRVAPDRHATAGVMALAVSQAVAMVRGGGAESPPVVVASAAGGDESLGSGSPGSARSSVRSTPPRGILKTGSSTSPPSGSSVQSALKMVREQQDAEPGRVSISRQSSGNKRVRFSVRHREPCGDTARSTTFHLPACADTLRVVHGVSFTPGRACAI